MEFEIQNFLEGKKAFYRSLITGGITEIEIKSVFVTFQIQSNLTAKECRFIPNIKVKTTTGNCYHVHEIFTELTDERLKMIQALNELSRKKSQTIEDIKAKFKLLNIKKTNI